VGEREAQRAVVVRPGDGHRVGNVEFLARSADTPRFNLGIVTVKPRRNGPGEHVHPDEDDSFYVLDGELVFTVEDEEIVVGPGTFLLVPPGLRHDFSNRTDRPARFLNIHAPAGFDLRLES
jgi:mannose-6-phosphate isomerase-like protein (cupin superfamily)